MHEHEGARRNVYEGQWSAPNTNEPRDEPRCRTKSSLEKALHYKKIQQNSTLGKTENFVIWVVRAASYNYAFRGGYVVVERAAAGRAGAVRAIAPSRAAGSPRRGFVPQAQAA
jgi:hypothetical protein